MVPRQAAWTAAFGLAALVSIGLSACGIRIGDPGPQGEVGVTVEDGQVLLRVNPCDADAEVQLVELRTATGKPGKEGDLLWRIRAEGGSGLRDYNVGKTPKGFVESVRLGAIEPGEKYVARVNLVSPGQRLITAFAPDSLEESMWLDSRGDSFSDQEFEDLRRCG